MTSDSRLSITLSSGGTVTFTLRELVSSHPLFSIRELVLPRIRSGGEVVVVEDSKDEVNDGTE